MCVSPNPPPLLQLSIHPCFNTTTSTSSTPTFGEQVVMTRGQAHAPIFTAKLSVPQVVDSLVLLVLV